MPVDFIDRSSPSVLDPDLSRIIAGEDRRQDEKIILIASESIAAPAVKELMASNFANIYAEGYPRAASQKQDENEILDIDFELAHYRRYSDPRYYKGVEYADILEALTRRRAAQLFAANRVTADGLFVNVQPLSGSPANSAAYSALLEPNDTLMGLDLNHGGHLTHGSKVSRSGTIYNSVPYTLNLETEQLDYDAIESLALSARPKVIVAGYTAYPLFVDWNRFRQIANRVGAYLLADISHISGLVAGGVHPSPIGIADVVTTTTHKSLCGPRGAMIMTHRPELARKIDRAVFPGEQGGPHLNTMAALALALKLATTDAFQALQQRVVNNASRLAGQLAAHGLRIVAGGTQNHLLLIDTKSVMRDGIPLSGDMAARILDNAGLVTNSNTIPGDNSPKNASGVRLGTVWISQLGYGESEIDILAEAIATLLKGCQPFTYAGLGGRRLRRAKVDNEALAFARMSVAKLAKKSEPPGSSNVVEIRGPEAIAFLNDALTSDVSHLQDGQVQRTHIILPDIEISGSLQRIAKDRFFLQCPNAQSARQAVTRLKDLSDGFLLFDDLQAKLPGPVAVRCLDPAPEILQPVRDDTGFADHKTYFIGWQKRPLSTDILPEFSWQEPDNAPLQRTNLYKTHVELGARMVPFGGWDMPVWYTSVSEEHLAVRNSAGLFDVSHMGVLEAAGPYAAEFLNQVTTNDVMTLQVGQSHYTYLLAPDGAVIDDLMIYRRGPEKYMLVVNASNNDKDWAWLNAVNEGLVAIDKRRPWAKVLHPARLRDLRDGRWKEDCLVDIALQGPRATDILISLCDEPELANKVRSLPWTGLTEGMLAGIPAVISRTGYTGERVAYELFVHPEKTPGFWQALMATGQAWDLKPCGLAARDSTRTEAGLPLYGHELAGPLALNPAEAGFASYVKTWKPFFIGRAAYLEKEKSLDREIVRFRMNEKAVRPPGMGDPIMDKRGKVSGTVTSCAIDRDGYLLGQAVMPTSMSEPGTSVAIYQLGGGTRTIQVPKEVGLGSRLPHPDGATILSRFPKP